MSVVHTVQSFTDVVLLPRNITARHACLGLQVLKKQLLVNWWMRWNFNSCFIKQITTNLNIWILPGLQFVTAIQLFWVWTECVQAENWSHLNSRPGWDYYSNVLCVVLQPCGWAGLHTSRARTAPHLAVSGPHCAARSRESAPVQACSAGRPGRTPWTPADTGWVW